MSSAASVITAILIFAGGIFTTVITGLFAKRRTHVEAEVTLSEQSRRWAEDFAKREAGAVEQAREANERAERAERRSEACQRRMDVMEKYIETLVELLRKHGVEPPPLPPRWNGKAN